MATREARTTHAAVPGSPATADVAGERSAPVAHPALLRAARIPAGQRQAIAARIAGGQSNARLARALAQRSPVADSAPLVELPVHERVEDALRDGRGATEVFEILREVDGAEAHNAELADALECGLENLDTLWIAQQLQAFGMETSWPADLQDELVKRKRDAVVGELAGMAGEKAGWKKSQGRFTREHDPAHPTATTFAQWAEAETESAAPELSPLMTLNCWEMILLAAYNAGSLGWQAIHDIYVKEPTDPAKNPNAWFKFLARRLTPSGKTAYSRVPSPGPLPTAGDIVLFDGVDHVALATGLDDHGDAKVLSFFPPKDEGNYDNRFGTVGATRLTTIEWLAKQMDDGEQPTVVRFGTPPW